MEPAGRFPSRFCKFFDFVASFLERPKPSSGILLLRKDGMTKHLEALMRNPWSFIVKRATKSKNLQNRLRFRHSALAPTSGNHDVAGLDDAEEVMADPTGGSRSRCCTCWYNVLERLPVGVAGR
ncbi:MAG: hypothetical protein ACLR3C_06150 [Eggerthella lenta]